ncbi:hypothetical protein QO209_13000 [Pseudomonas citronellolis]|uniref:hypothetical protein n=1 Tax=Pseudomonas citronellolis TaxID=53408 RepID=UPI002649E1FF|nr:hypothetical protein [Pseudomonas citronellolis]MDN6873355.1 hypothetical protein [Pseudomonas citronellolis]
MIYQASDKEINRASKSVAGSYRPKAALTVELVENSELSTLSKHLLQTIQITTSVDV